MNGRVVSLAIVVGALTCYHVAQRSMPASVRPAPLFAFVYGIAALVLVGVTLTTSASGAGEVADGARHWAPWLLVLSVTGIELGVLAMYRSGWSIGSASISTQAIVAAVLVIVGLLRFGEHLTAGRSVGVVLCMAGAAMLVAK